MPAAKKKKIILITSISAAVLITLLIPGIYYGVAAKGLKDDASALKASVKSCIGALKNGDAVSCDEAIKDLDATSAKMKAELDESKWNLPKIFPPIKQDFETCGQCLALVDKASETLLKPASDAVRDSGLPTNETVKLDNM